MCTKYIPGTNYVVYQVYNSACRTVWHRWFSVRGTVVPVAATVPVLLLGGTYRHYRGSATYGVTHAACNMWFRRNLDLIKSQLGLFSFHTNRFDFSLLLACSIMLFYSSNSSAGMVICYSWTSSVRSPWASYSWTSSVRDPSATHALLL